MWWKKFNKKLSPIEKEIIYFALLLTGFVILFWLMHNTAKIVRFFKKPRDK